MKSLKACISLAAFCVLGMGAATAAPIGYAIQSDGDDQLYSIDLATGVATAIGAVGFTDVEGLTFQPGTGVLFGVDDISDQLITIDLATGAGTAVGSLGVTFTDMGLAFDAAGNLWMATDIPETFYSIDPLTGAATAVGAQGQRVTGLAADGLTLYGLGGDRANNLVEIDPTTGAATSIGALGAGLNITDGGIAFDGSGVLWGLEDNGNIFSIDVATGAATVQASTLSDFEGLAIQATPQVTEPAVLGMIAAGITGLGLAGWRRRRPC